MSAACVGAVVSSQCQAAPQRLAAGPRYPCLFGTSYAAERRARWRHSFREPLPRTPLPQRLVCAHHRRPSFRFFVRRRRRAQMNCEMASGQSARRAGAAAEARGDAIVGVVLIVVSLVGMVGAACSLSMFDALVLPPRGLKK